MSKQKLFLLDGMALAYRAHFAFINSNLKNSEGIPTGAILGFANTLVKMLEEDEPSHIAVAWDTDQPTFRHEMDEEYKANRPPQPEDLKVGIPLMKEMVSYFGIDNIEAQGYEADDIIGTIANDANAEDIDVYLVTPDKDFMQLVHDHIMMLKPDNKNGGFIKIDREGVKDYFGVYPEKVVDVLAILGDKSDNIPGVKGIGKKGAPKLINKYGSLEKAIKEAPNMKSKRHREGLQKYKEQALHAKEMVKIKTDVPDVIDWEGLKWNGPNNEKLGRFFQRMEFRTLTEKYLDEKYQGDLFDAKPEVQRFNKEEVNYELITDRDQLEELVADLSEYEVICFDTETNGTDPMVHDLVGISLSAVAGVAYYIPVNVEGALEQGQVVDTIRPLFADAERTMVAQNYKFDWLVLNRVGIALKGKIFDTMLAAYLIDANQKLSMDALSEKHLHYKPIPITELIGKGRGQITFGEVPIEKAAPYAAEDADITYRLYEILKDKLEDDALTDIAEDIEFPLVEVLGRMEKYGIKLDQGMLKEVSAQLDKEIGELESRIFEIADEEFNLNSPKQMGEILFEKLGLPAGKKTKTGQYSTAESVLTKLADDYEIVELILEYRGISKLKSTYVDALPKLINEQTGRIHTSFNQHIAATGRLSSSNPNLQNIPIRSQRGREIRKAFIPEQGYKLLAADYSQVELRVIASIAQDKAMMAAFRNDEDIHARTAKEIFDLDSLDEVTGNQRRKAKEVNFGIPYGVSAYGLAQRLGISNGEAKEMIDQYFNRFPGIQRYIDETKAFAKEEGYVKTLLGRRRYIPDINSRNWTVRGFAERTAINMPIQGTAADIIKIAMINIDQMIEQEGLKSRMLLQVHDELVFEIADEEADALPGRIQKMMEQAYTLDVPLKVEMGLADNWLDAH
ncbi:MAG: DNA polymerase I [Bacteroidota bacterium]